MRRSGVSISLLLTHTNATGMGISVDEVDLSSNGAEQALKEAERPEFEIQGVFETVLKNNMEQLQWTSLSVMLLSLSTSLLAVAQDIPAHIVASKHHLTVAGESLPDVVAFSVDLSEQVHFSYPFACHSTNLSEVSSVLSAYETSALTSQS
jgi:hypothetical protein